MGKEEEHSASSLHLGPSQRPSAQSLEQLWASEAASLPGTRNLNLLHLLQCPHPRQGGDKAKKKATESPGQVGQSHMVPGLQRSSSVETGEPAKAGGGRQRQARGNAKQEALQPSRQACESGFLDA